MRLVVGCTLSALVLGCAATQTTKHQLPCGDPLPGYEASQCHCEKAPVQAKKDEPHDESIGGGPQYRAGKSDSDNDNAKPSDIVVCVRSPVPQSFCLHPDGTKTPGECEKPK